MLFINQLENTCFLSDEVRSMRRVTATREVVNSVRRKCSDKIIDMFLIIF